MRVSAERGVTHEYGTLRGRFRCVLLIRYSRKWYNRQTHRRYNRYSHMYIYTYVHAAPEGASARIRIVRECSPLRGAMPGCKSASGLSLHRNITTSRAWGPTRILFSSDRREIQSRKKGTSEFGHGHVRERERGNKWWKRRRRRTKEEGSTNGRGREVSGGLYQRLENVYSLLYTKAAAAMLLYVLPVYTLFFFVFFCFCFFLIELNVYDAIIHL